MSAQRVEVDGPVSYALTELAEATLAVAQGQTLTYTVREAARVLRRTPKYVSMLARESVLDAVKVDDCWLIDGASVVAYGETHPHRLLALPRARQEVSQRPRLTLVPPYEDEDEQDDPEVGNLLRERVPAGPLLRQIELASAAGRLERRLGEQEQKAIDRARHEGTFTIRAADQLAVTLLGLTLWDLYDL